MSTDTSTLQAELETCFGTDSLGSLTLEDVSSRDYEYAQCLNASGVVTYTVNEDFYYTEPNVDNGWENLAQSEQASLVSSSSPCGSNPNNASATCCAGISAALSCQLSADSQLTASCKEMLDGVVFETYKCSSTLREYAGLIGVLGALVVTALVALTVLRHRAFGALLRKNFILWWQHFFATLAAQICALVLVGALAGVLLGLTGMETTYYTLDFLGLTLAFTTPDSNRKLIYQNLRPFGGLFFLITFTYPVANMTVSLVMEKQSRMKEAMRISGMRDWMQMSTWTLTFLLKYLPMVAGCAVLAHYGAIFPNENVPTLVLFFLAFVFSLVGFSFLVAVFFSRTRPAAIASVCISFLLFFSSFHFLNTSSMRTQRSGCYIAPVCLALGINTMLDDASLGNGFARAASLLTGQLDGMISVEEASRRLVLAGFLYLVAAWYLDKVVPQTHGVRQRPDFFLQPVYPWARRAWTLARDQGRRRCCGAGDEIASLGLRALDASEKGCAATSADNPADSASDSASDTMATSEDGDLRMSLSEMNLEYTTSSRVSVRRLSKEFRINGLGAKRKAVNDLSFSFEKDKVTALLGANGAGKSTLIKMLTGMLVPTSGDVSVFGLSVRTQMHAIRGRLGWCPQHDILYPSLTVRQHLELFSALRGKRLDKVATQELLVDLALADKFDAKARTLSGGQRRKLCLAIALIGDTELIVLDEMTAGVDPVSRRACWNVIQNNRAGRAILLTTHFLDEADVLGDQIAIIANGSLCCQGSSLELKRKYGDGYRLTVGLPHAPPPSRGSQFRRGPQMALAGPAVDAQRVTQVVYEEVANASNLGDEAGLGSAREVAVGNAAEEVKFALPFAGVKAFPGLLRRLENELGCTVSISISTLEQVFLKVAAQHTEEDLSLERLRAVEPYVACKGRRKRRGFWALLCVKRLNYARRDVRSFALVIILPVLFCCALLVIPDLYLYSLIYSGDGVDAPRGTDACEAMIPGGTLGWAQTNESPVEYSTTSTSSSTVDTAGRTCCPQVNSTTATVSLTRQFETCVESLPQCVDVQDAEREQANCFVHTYSFCYALPWLCDASACCDPRSHKSPFYLCQSATALDPTYLFSDTDQVNYNQYCNTRDIGVAQEYVNAFVRTLVVFLGFVFPSGSVIAFAVLETEALRETKFQQLVNGVRKSTYWSAHWVFDQATTALPVVALPAVLLGASTATSMNYAHVVIAQAVQVTAAFVFACVPLAYAMSFSFRRHADALVWMVVFQIVSGGALSVLAYVLKVVPLQIGALSTSSLVDDYLRYALSLFPGYAFADGLLRLQMQIVDDCASSNPWRTLGRCTNLLPESVDDATESQITAALATATMADLEGRYSPDEDEVLVNVLYMCGVAAASWMYVTLRELQVLRPGLWCSCLRRDGVVAAHNRRQAQTPAEVAHDDVVVGAAEVDVERALSGRSLLRKGAEDVAAERARVSGGPGSAAADAVQFLGLTKRYGRKLALDDLWLGVGRGEVFGYLGVNGAGKSTTIKLLTGAEAPSAGSAAVLGRSVRTEITKARRSMGYCPQHEALYELLTVREHLVMYAMIRGLHNVFAAVRSSIDRMQLKRFENVIAKQLSGGNKRKLSAAIAMLGSPEVIVLDEPTSGVDPLSQRFLWDVVRDTTQRTRSAVLLVSHSMPEVEALSTRIGVLISGRLRAIGTASRLKALYGSAVAVEVTLGQAMGHLAPPASLLDDEDYVTRGRLRAICQTLGAEWRFEALQPGGAAASSVVAFALNSPAVGRISWLEFERWWLQEDAVARVASVLRSAWGQNSTVVSPADRDASVDLVDRHGSYLMFSVSNRGLPVADIFEFLEREQHALGFVSYAVSTTGLEAVFQSVVENAADSCPGEEHPLGVPVAQEVQLGVRR